jgi:hypothetical protein
MGDAKRSTGLVFGAILAGNAGILAACGGGGSGAVPPQVTQSPAPSPSPTSSTNTSQSTETVNVGASPVTTSLAAVGGVTPTITIPGISNAPPGSTATITFSEITQLYPANARRIIRRDGTAASYAGWDMEMFFYFDPEFDASVTATFNVGTSNPSKYWYLDEFSDGLPNCNGLVGPGRLSNGNVSFTGLTNPTPPPAIQEPNGQYVIKFTVIGALNPISEDPFCATPSPSPSPTTTTSPTVMPSTIPATSTPFQTPTPRPTPTQSPTPRPTPTTSPTIMPTSVPGTATPTPTATYGPVSLLPTEGIVSPGQSEGFQIAQEYNGGTEYTGPFTVSTGSCAGYVTVTSQSGNLFTIAAGSTATTCDMTITGSAGISQMLEIDIL